MKKFLSVILALALIVTLTSAVASADNKAKYTMNIGSAMTETHPVSIALEQFKKNVEERTNGEVAVNHYGNSTLGGEIELLEQNISGLLEASMQMGAANFESYNGAADVALLPFLFSSVDSAREAWGGAFGEKFAEEIVAPTGVTALTFVESGMRHMTNNTRPLVVPEDLKGIKFRTNENKMKVKMYEALNGSVVMMPFFNIGLESDFGSFARAVMEGVAFSIRDCAGLITDTLPGDRPIPLGGGVANSTFWCQIFADVMNRPMIKLKNNETETLGDIIIAANAVGLTQIPPDFGKTQAEKGEILYPNPENVKVYDWLFHRYKELYQRTEPMFKKP